jgi:mono/diheme cytochrome c family protein
MQLRFPLIALAAAVPLLGAVWQADAADRDRGMVLYEARCVACHTTSVHNRENRKAKSYAEVREWVTRWSNFLGSDWGPAEIEDVSRYVNDRFYSFPCPVEVCRVGS